MKRRRNLDKEYNLKLPALILVVIFIMVILILVVKKYNSCTSLTTITKNPFDTIEILDEKVRLREDKKTYEIEIDCNNIKDDNEQIVYYRLNEEYKASKVSVKTYVFDDNYLIEKDFKDMTSIETILSINIKDKYEHVYNIKATCIAQEEDEKEIKEEKTEKEEKSTKKK